MNPHDLQTFRAKKCCPVPNLPIYMYIYADDRDINNVSNGLTIPGRLPSQALLCIDIYVGIYIHVYICR